MKRIKKKNWSKRKKYSINNSCLKNVFQFSFLRRETNLPLFTNFSNTYIYIYHESFPSNRRIVSFTWITHTFRISDAIIARGIERRRRIGGRENWIPEFYEKFIERRQTRRVWSRINFHLSFLVLPKPIPNLVFAFRQVFPNFCQARNTSSNFLRSKNFIAKPYIYEYIYLFISTYVWNNIS